MVFSLEMIICMQECARQAFLGAWKTVPMTGNVCVFGSERGPETAGVRSDPSVFCARPPGAATQQQHFEERVSPETLQFKSFSFPART